ncbi:Uncharacterised protein [Serratia plymuthica]|nr:Uncharacterised protein [Serratia plymuthica]
MSVTFCMMIPFRKKNTLSAYRSQGGGDHLINRSIAAPVFYCGRHLLVSQFHFVFAVHNVFVRLLHQLAGDGAGGH